MAPTEFDSAEELISEMKDAGVTRAGLIVGVDFTRSNEWTGQRCYGKGSMHDVSGPEPNPYQQVLEAVGRGLAPLNASKKIWCYGFGDKTTKDKGVFCFMADDQPCRDIHQMMERYGRIAPKVSLYGPTSFAPLIRKAIEIVEDSGGQYHCLVIIADGQVTKERETIKAIQDASSYPLSIIMVGVGEGPWDACRVFDTRLPGRRFDNFRFLEHRRVKRREPQALALSALAEVPDQYRAIRALGLIRGDNPWADSSEGLRDTNDVTPRVDAFQHASAPVPVTASVPGAPLPEETTEEEELPQGFLCPLTLEVMIDPVVCEDGHSYERGAIEAWLKDHNTGPMSNVRLKSTAVVPNHALRNSIEAWHQKKGY